MSHPCLDYCVPALLLLSSKNVARLERALEKGEKDNQRKGNRFCKRLTE